MKLILAILVLFLVFLVDGSNAQEQHLKPQLCVQRMQHQIQVRDELSAFLATLDPDDFVSFQVVYVSNAGYSAHAYVVYKCFAAKENPARDSIHLPSSAAPSIPSLEAVALAGFMWIAALRLYG